MNEDVLSYQYLGSFKETCLNKFDHLLAADVYTLSPADIRTIRCKTNTCQAEFARYLNTDVHTVEQWENGLITPSGESLKLLNIIDKMRSGAYPLS